MLAVFLGAGRLATSLAPALAGCGVRITQVYSRTNESAMRLALCLEERTSQQPAVITDLAAIDGNADIYVYALRDDVIEWAARKVAEIDGTRNAIHLHTSGSVPLQVLSDVFPRAAVLYPFQSFSLGKVVDMTNVPIFVEATTDEVLAKVRGLAERLSSQVYVADGERRSWLHVAGVFANNFSNAMFALAEKQLQKADLPFSVLLPLIRQTAQKMETMTPREAQTGPASRGDVETIEEHLKMLDGREKEIYKIVTECIEKGER